MTEFLIRYWLECALGVISAGLGALWCKLRVRVASMQKKHQSTENGVRALLRAEIVKTYNRYMDKGEIPIHELENIADLYTQYTNLGGNGVVHNLIEDLNELPIKRG